MRKIVTENEAFELIKASLERVADGTSQKVTMNTDLVGDEILDSLDVMNFLFELETERGEPITAIDESFEDFRIATLVDLIVDHEG